MSSCVTSGLTGAFTGQLDDEALEGLAGQLAAMAEVAPSEIQDDMEVVAEELGKFYQALADMD